MIQDITNAFAELLCVANFSIKAIKEYRTLSLFETNNKNKWRGKPFHRRQAYIRARRNCNAV